MLYFIGLVVAFLVGAGAMFFILKNNPKLLNIEKLTKEQLQELQAKIKAKIG